MPLKGSSPLTRGKPSLRRRSAARREAHPRSRGENSVTYRPCRLGCRLIPAHAGKTIAPLSSGPCERAHPRSRGENVPSWIDSPMIWGSSPLTRGKQPLTGGGVLAGRLIPAHAGKTSACQRLPAASRAHPRSRGENCKRPSTRSSTVGSSPLTRGKLLSSFCVGDGGGLIPAHAGKTEADRCPVVQSWAHPRSRGENLLLVLPSGSIQGSSPLTRGKRRARHSCSARRRLIPAHAGKTSVCVLVCSVEGSSPLTRGKHAQTRDGLCILGLIPAHAGKTMTAIDARACRGAHPRSRGENQALDVDHHPHAGSSPLTRGKRDAPRRESESRRLIPAHAGKT